MIVRYLYEDGKKARGSRGYGSIGGGLKRERDERRSSSGFVCNVMQACPASSFSLFPAGSFVGARTGGYGEEVGSTVRIYKESGSMRMKGWRSGTDGLEEVCIEREER